MCRAIVDGGRRCSGIQGHWHVNREGHLRFLSDVAEERHWMKPPPLMSMTAEAIRTRRCRARKYAAEVAAIRTIHGLAPEAPIGPVLREELWAARYQGAALSLVALAERFRAVADDEGITVDQVAARYANQVTIPHRQSAGERLADLVMERADWVRPEHLVRSVEPPDNGTPNPAYLRVVADADGAEWVLVTSYDGSEPQAWKADDAGMKAGAWECLERVKAVNSQPDAYETWLAANDAADTRAGSPYEQTMAVGDFLANSDGVHLI